MWETEECKIGTRNGQVHRVKRGRSTSSSLWSAPLCAGDQWQCHRTLPSAPSAPALPTSHPCFFLPLLRLMHLLPSAGTRGRRDWVPPHSRLPILLSSIFCYFVNQKNETSSVRSYRSQPGARTSSLQLMERKGALLETLLRSRQALKHIKTLWHHGGSLCLIAVAPSPSVFCFP